MLQIMQTLIWKIPQECREYWYLCHYAEEHTVLTSIRKELTIQSNNPDQKYFLLSNPIIIPPHEDVPETMYTHLYIRKPDNNKSQVGDVDFFLSVEDYKRLNYRC